MSEFAFVFGLTSYSRQINDGEDCEFNVTGKNYEEAMAKILRAEIPYLDEKSLYLKEFYDVVVIVKEGE